MRHTRISNHIQQPRVRQRGMVLIITMIMLFVMTLIMVSAIRANVGEERMAGNARDWNTAFQAAESALHDAERDILVGRFSGKTDFIDGCTATGGLCLPSTTGTPIWVTLLATDPGWMTGANSGTKTVKYGAYTSVADLPDVGAQPRYIIEVLSVPPAGSLKIGHGSVSVDYLYRVTAVGFGANITSRVMLQGIYRQH